MALCATTLPRKFRGWRTRERYNPRIASERKVLHLPRQRSARWNEPDEIIAFRFCRVRRSTPRSLSTTSLRYRALFYVPRNPFHHGARTRKLDWAKIRGREATDERREILPVYHSAENFQGKPIFQFWQNIVCKIINEKGQLIKNIERDVL